MERWSIPIALFILFIAWWIFATAMHRWNGWRDTAHEMCADRDKWRREAEKATAMAGWLAGELGNHAIYNPPGTDGKSYWAWESKMPETEKQRLWLKAAAEVVQEATDDR